MRHRLGDRSLGYGALGLAVGVMTDLALVYVIAHRAPELQRQAARTTP